MIIIIIVIIIIVMIIIIMIIIMIMMMIIIKIIKNVTTQCRKKVEQVSDSSLFVKILVVDVIM